jgi:hypothetical protein
MDLWAQAVAQLDVADQKGADFGPADKPAILADVLEEVLKKQRTCRERKLRYRTASGKTIILFDVFEKIARWVNKLKEIGDAVMQYDPGYAALPWAAMRFFIQVHFQKDLSSFYRTYCIPSDCSY